MRSLSWLLLVLKEREGREGPEETPLRAPESPPKSLRSLSEDNTPLDDAEGYGE